eukprot:COSAG02_NODE_520_length_20751_cov_17.817112_18_plen_82_part_00
MSHTQRQNQKWALKQIELVQANNNNHGTEPSREFAALHCLTLSERSAPCARAPSTAKDGRNCLRSLGGVLQDKATPASVNQ